MNEDSPLVISNSKQEDMQGGTPLATFCMQAASTKLRYRMIYRQTAHVKAG